MTLTPAQAKDEVDLSTCLDVRYLKSGGGWGTGKLVYRDGQSCWDAILDEHTRKMVYVRTDNWELLHPRDDAGNPK